MGTFIAAVASIAVPLLINDIDKSVRRYKKGKINFSQFEAEVTKKLSKIRGTHQTEYNKAIAALGNIPYQASSSTVKTGRRAYAQRMRAKALKSEDALNKVNAGEALVRDRLNTLSNDPTAENKDKVINALNLVEAVEKKA